MCRSAKNVPIGADGLAGLGNYYRQRFWDAFVAHPKFPRACIFPMERYSFGEIALEVSVVPKTDLDGMLHGIRRCPMRHACSIDASIMKIQHLVITIENHCIRGRCTHTALQAPVQFLLETSRLALDCVFSHREQSASQTSLREAHHLASYLWIA